MMRLAITRWKYQNSLHNLLLVVQAEVWASNCLHSNPVSSSQNNMLRIYSANSQEKTTLGTPVPFPRIPGLCSSLVASAGSQWYVPHLSIPDCEELEIQSQHSLRSFAFALSQAWALFLLWILLFMTDCAQENLKKPHLAYSTPRESGSLLLTIMGLQEPK